MKKLQWLFPLGALIIFIFIYMNSRNAIVAKHEAEKQAKIEENKRREDENARRREEEKEKRRLTKEKKDKEEAEEKARKDAEKKYYEEIDYARDFAKREAVRYDNVVNDLTKSFDAEKAAQKDAEAAIAAMRDEKKFIVEYVAKAKANEKALKDLLVKLEELEKARIAAATAANAR